MMRYCLRLLLIGCWFAFAGGCAYQQMKVPDIAETEAQLTTDCQFLGMIAETADAGMIIRVLATNQMINRVKIRADRLGATHIVWLHKTDVAATAKAFRCGPPDDQGPQ